MLPLTIQKPNGSQKENIITHRKEIDRKERDSYFYGVRIHGFEFMRSPRIVEGLKLQTTSHGSDRNKVFRRSRHKLLQAMRLDWTYE